MKKEKAKQKVKKNIPKSNKKDTINKRKIYIFLIIIGIVFLTLIFSYGWYSLVYQNKIFANVKIGDIEFSGLSKQNASDLLKSKLKEADQKELQLVSDNQKWSINLADADLNYDLDSTIEKLYSIGRNKGVYENFKERLALLFNSKSIDAIYDIDQNSLNSLFSEVYKQVEQPVVDAKFEYKNNQITILVEKSGVEIDKAKIYNDLDKILSSLSVNNHIDLILQNAYPKITQEKLLSIKDEFINVLKDDIVLQSELKNITITKDQIASWFFTVSVYNSNKKISLMSRAYANEENNYVAKLELNQEEIKKFVAQIATDVNKDPKDAKLSFTDGSVSIYQTPEKGYKLDQDTTVLEITNLVLAKTKIAGIASNSTTDVDINSLKLPLQIIEPDISDTNVNELGIKEMISSGTTSFAGSAQNRIYNIKKGASVFNGVVIKPNEKLSAISILGNPSAESGYLPELVIKENKTIPEYGGGLCQVSTTLFRASLNAGLEILERTNHAYRVSYYEPPVGMDATIYYPKPDLIIKNNTPASILIQTSVTGSQITFTMYGTKDDRIVEISDPQIYDTVSPPKDIYIESSDLPAGTIKKQEGSHPGAKASFYYKVVKSGKTIFEKTFNSVYKAWQGIYLFGSGANLPDGADAKDKDGNKIEVKKDAGGNRCDNECEEGWTECKDDGIRSCNKDGDCLRWSAVGSCGDGKTCSNNQCVNE